MVSCCDGVSGANRERFTGFVVGTPFDSASRAYWTSTVAALALLLTACATPSTPGPIAEPAPKAVDARLCAKAEPEPPIAGGIVQPASDSERASTAEFLTSVSEALSWGRRGWERAKVAAKGCG